MIKTHELLLNRILAEFPELDAQELEAAFPDKLVLEDRHLIAIFEKAVELGASVTMSNMDAIMIGWEQDQVAEIVASGYQLSHELIVDEASVKSRWSDIFIALCTPAEWKKTAGGKAS